MIRWVTQYIYKKTHNIKKNIQPAQRLPFENVVPIFWTILRF